GLSVRRKDGTCKRSIGEPSTGSSRRSFARVALALRGRRGPRVDREQGQRLGLRGRLRGRSRRRAPLLADENGARGRVSAGGRGLGMKVLVVEDEEKISQFLKKGL